jgi:hypothetical protein
VAVTTFADLGVPVPLFLGEHRYAEGVTDGHRCVLCDRAGVCLPLDDVMVPCDACGGQTRIRARRRSDTCHRCGGPVTLPAAAGYDLFAEIVRDVDPSATADAWEHGLTPHGGEPDLRVYVFRCQQCDTLRTHSDCD